MDSSVSGKDKICFLRVCHHVPHELYFVCSGGVTTAMTTVYLRILHDLIPTELLVRGVKWGMIVRHVTLVKQRVQQALVIHKA